MSGAVTAGIAMVPCPWCGSTFPLVHDGGCFLILAEQRAMEQGYKSGYEQAQLDNAAALAAARAAGWEAARTEAVAVLNSLRRDHLYVEDCWYSCPKSEEGCCDDRQVECTCGADAHNARIDAAIAALAHPPTPDTAGDARA